MFSVNIPIYVDVAGFCLSLSSMNLSVFWYAASGHYVYIDCSVMLCFAGRDQTEPRSFVFMCIQTKAGLSAISHFGIQSQYSCVPESMNIKCVEHLLKAPCVPAQGLEYTAMLVPNVTVSTVYPAISPPTIMFSQSYTF